MSTYTLHTTSKSLQRQFQGSTQDNLIFLYFLNFLQQIYKNTILKSEFIRNGKPPLQTCRPYSTLHTDPPCDHFSRNIKVNKNCRHLWQNAAIRVLMTAPIFFWQNSDLFLKKQRTFSSSKIDNFRAFQRKSLKIFKENLSNFQ